MLCVTPGVEKLRELVQCWGVRPLGRVLCPGTPGLPESPWSLSDNQDAWSRVSEGQERKGFWELHLAVRCHQLWLCDAAQQESSWTQSKVCPALTWSLILSFLGLYIEILLPWTQSRILWTRNKQEILGEITGVRGFLMCIFFQEGSKSFRSGCTSGAWVRPWPSLVQAIPLKNCFLN